MTSSELDLSSLGDINESSISISSSVCDLDLSESSRSSLSILSGESTSFSVTQFF